MIYRQVACVFLALMTANGVAAEVRPGANNNTALLRAEAVAKMFAEASETAESDLTGYWQAADGETFYFTQEGSSLTSRHTKRSANNAENEIDFTATVHGNLVYGAHRGPFSRAMEQKCSRQIWVGMGLTLNDDRNELTGFRGDRIIDPENCTARNSDPVGLVYNRIADIDPLK